MFERHAGHRYQPMPTSHNAMPNCHCDHHHHQQYDNRNHCQHVHPYHFTLLLTAIAYFCVRLVEHRLRICSSPTLTMNLDMKAQKNDESPPISHA